MKKLTEGKIDKEVEKFMKDLENCYIKITGHKNGSFLDVNGTTIAIFTLLGHLLLKLQTDSGYTDEEIIENVKKGMIISKEMTLKVDNYVRT